jgi:hypothetical protein
MADAHSKGVGALANQALDCWEVDQGKFLVGSIRVLGGLLLTGDMI